MSRAARVVAHAKVNLVLRVLGRGADGYHDIQTLFARLALGDDVTVRVDVAGRSIDCHGADVGPPERNLAMRAAVAYVEASAWPSGFAIEIEKRIPAGGGLGGGSADAGAVLRALDALAPRPLGAVALLEIAGRLGSDVPFLTSIDAMALAWGRGERLLGVPALPERPVVLVFPDFSVSTADAYRWVDESRHAPEPAPLSPWSNEHVGDWNTVAGLSVNDFESPVGAHHPEVHDIIQRLRGAGAVIARLSGSGSTVFGVFAPGWAGSPLSAQAGERMVTTRTIARVSAVEHID